MAGSKEGGRKTAATNKRKYNEDFYSRLGKLGGSAKVPKGFAIMGSEFASNAGKMGGRGNKKGSK